MVRIESTPLGDVAIYVAGALTGFAADPARALEIGEEVACALVAAQARQRSGRRRPPLPTHRRLAQADACPVCGRINDCLAGCTGEER